MSDPVLDEATLLARIETMQVRLVVLETALTSMNGFIKSLGALNTLAGWAVKFVAFMAPIVGVTVGVMAYFRK